MPTVLVVEDEPDIREMVSLLLVMGGYDVVEAGTGEDALDHILGADAVLLDIRLPGISGLDVVEQVAVDARGRILFMSAHQDMHDDDIAGQYGCAGFIVKPFDFDEMLRMVAMIAPSN